MNAGNDYGQIIEKIAEKSGNIRHGIKQKRLTWQLELLFEIIKDLNFEKPHFLPFIKDNYLFDVVAEPYGLIESFRLRFLSYSTPDTAYINPELFPLGLEFDRYDKVSTHFYAKNLKNGQMCGYIRMIHNTPLGLQLEGNLDISDYRKKFKICEASRYTTYPRRQPIVRKILLENLKRFAKENGVEKILGEGHLKFKSFFDSIGSIPMHPLRTWKLRDKLEWGSERDEMIYGNIIHLNQEGDR